MDFLKNNVIQLLGLVGMLATFYGRFLLLEQEIKVTDEFWSREFKVIERRLEKKSQLLKELENRVTDLEKCRH